MSKAEIFSGICGFSTVVKARMTGWNKCALEIESECKSIQRLATVLTEVEPYREISFRKEGPLTLQMATQYCAHTACIVPSGIIKAIEVESGLALPKDASIKISKDGAS